MRKFDFINFAKMTNFIFIFNNFFPYTSYSKIGPETRRFCRCGAGQEKTPGKGDTPGFQVTDKDTIEEEKFKGMKILRLKRTEGRMKQTSISTAKCFAVLKSNSHNGVVQ